MPNIGILIERQCMKFVNKMLDHEHFLADCHASIVMSLEDIFRYISSKTGQI